MIHVIKLHGSVGTQPRIDRDGNALPEDGMFECYLEANLQVEALTLKAAQEIALTRANELFGINDSGENVEFELVSEPKKPARSKARAR